MFLDRLLKTRFKYILASASSYCMIPSCLEVPLRPLLPYPFELGLGVLPMGAEGFWKGAEPLVKRFQKLIAGHRFQDLC